MTTPRGYISRIRWCLWSIAILVLLDIIGNVAGRYIIVTGMVRMLAEHDTRVRDTVVRNQERILANETVILDRLERLEGRR